MCVLFFSFLKEIRGFQMQAVWPTLESSLWVDIWSWFISTIPLKSSLFDWRVFVKCIRECQRKYCGRKKFCQQFGLLTGTYFGCRFAYHHQMSSFGIYLSAVFNKISFLNIYSYADRNAWSMWVFRILCMVSVFYPVHVIQLSIMATYKLIRGHSAGFICGIRTVSVCVYI